MTESTDNFEDDPAPLSASERPPSDRKLDLIAGYTLITIMVAVIGVLILRLL